MTAARRWACEGSQRGARWVPINAALGSEAPPRCCTAVVQCTYCCGVSQEQWGGLVSPPPAPGSPTNAARTCASRHTGTFYKMLIPRWFRNCICTRAYVYLNLPGNSTARYQEDKLPQSVVSFVLTLIPFGHSLYKTCPTWLSKDPCNKNKWYLFLNISAGSEQGMK